MSYRYMRVVVFFDLPVLTERNRKEYRDFRKFLIKSGFLMMQESVYCKLVQNSVAADLLVESIKKHKPSTGLIQLLKLTEKQYAKIEYIVGGNKSNIIDSDEKLIIL